MENVVYLLGAGFSAPLGLPVMSNFLVKSKDIYFQNPEKYKHFLSVFNLIDEMSKSKNYYEADLFNTEEILSILVMREQLAGAHDKPTFLEYIANVIESVDRNEAVERLTIEGASEVLEAAPSPNTVRNVLFGSRPG